ncbi:scaffold protein involved in DNA repair [Massilia sp. B-10]|nr:scaffold protein involved in DNA repair [Massilia sp. B-10]
MHDLQLRPQQRKLLLQEQREQWLVVGNHARVMLAP